jgi:hypothetical protein
LHVETIVEVGGKAEQVRRAGAQKLLEKTGESMMATEVTYGPAGATASDIAARYVATSSSWSRDCRRRSVRSDGLRFAIVAWRLQTFPYVVPDPIVQEELALVSQVNARLDAAAPEHAPSEAALVAELEHLRDTIRDGGTKEEDRAALVQQFDRHSALLTQLRNAERAPAIDTTSPYFAHLKLREKNGVQDILIGKTTRLLADYPIVDWRNAPISRVFYRYRQGEEYEEEIAGRAKEGVVLARRTVSIRDRRLRRIDAPEGIFQTEDGAPDGWSFCQDLMSTLNHHRPGALDKAGDLRTYAAGLRANRNIRIIENQNDILLEDEDLQWFHATFAPEQLTVFEQGGHLGNLAHPAVQKAILRALDGLRSP